jgi:hypothetical protein
MELSDIKNFINKNPRVTLYIVITFLIILSLIISDANFIAEVIGIGITVILIEWILNGPKRNLKETAKFDIDGIIFRLNLDLINAKGFEQNLYYDATQISERGDSFESAISSTTQLLKKITIEDMIKKIESMEIDDLLNIERICGEKEKGLKGFKEDFILSLDYNERIYLLECLRSLLRLNRNCELISSSRSTKSALKELKTYCAFNLKDLLDNLYSLSDSLSGERWTKKIFRRFNQKGG